MGGCDDDSSGCSDATKACDKYQACGREKCSVELSACQAACKPYDDCVATCAPCEDCGKKCSGVRTSACDSCFKTPYQCMSTKCATEQQACFEADD